MEINFCLDGSDACAADAMLQWRLGSLVEYDSARNPSAAHYFDTNDSAFAFDGTEISSPCWLTVDNSSCLTKMAEAAFPRNGDGSYGSSYSPPALDGDFDMSCNETRLVSGTMGTQHHDGTNRVLNYGLHNWNFSSGSDRLAFIFSVRLTNTSIDSSDISVYDLQDGLMFDLAGVVKVFQPKTCMADEAETHLVYWAYHRIDLGISGYVELPVSDSLQVSFDIALLAPAAELSVASSSSASGDNRTSSASASSSGYGSMSPSFGSPIRMDLCANEAETCTGITPKLEWTLLSLHEVDSSGNSVHMFHEFDNATDDAFAFTNATDSTCLDDDLSLCSLKTAAASFPNDGDAGYGRAETAQMYSNDFIMECNHSRLVFGDISTYWDPTAIHVLTYRFHNWNFSDPTNRLRFAFIVGAPIGDNGGYNSAFYMDRDYGKILGFRDTAVIWIPKRLEMDSSTVATVQVTNSFVDSLIATVIDFPASNDLEYRIDIAPIGSTPATAAPTPNHTMISPYTATPLPTSTRRYGSSSSAVRSSVCAANGMCYGSWGLAVVLESVREIDYAGNPAHLSHYFDYDGDAMFEFTREFTTSCWSPYSLCSVKIATATFPYTGGYYYDNATSNEPTNRDFVMEYNQTRLFSGLMDQTFLDPDVNRTLTFDFRNWNFSSPSNWLRFTFSFGADNITTPYDSWPDANGWVFVIGSYKVFLPRMARFENDNWVWVGGAYELVGDNVVKFSLDLPASNYIQYRVAISPSTTATSISNVTWTNWTSTEPEAGVPDVIEVEGGKPSTALNLFSGGFEFCIARDCNIDDGVLSVVLDRLGLAPVLLDTLEFWTVLSDFTQATGLNFGNASNEDAPHQMILKIPGTGGLAQCLDERSSAGQRDPTAIYLMLEVQRLTKTTITHIYNGTLVAPAGSLHIRASGLAPSGTTNRDRVGLSLLLFALQDDDIISTVRAAVTDSTAHIGIGDMFVSYPRYTIIDGNFSFSTVNLVAYPYASGDNEGLIELLLDFPPFRSNITYEFFIGSNNIQYQMPSNSSNATTTAPSGQDLVALGDMDSPTVAPDGKPVTTKLLAFPRGAFGLAFASENGTATSALKVAFTGLESTEGVKLTRFADAAAFVFSEPESVSEGDNEIWRVGFKALIPQSRMRPPMPYNATLAATFPTFAVTVDQYLIPGSTMNGNQSISVPRGGLKFSFSISNWHFASPTDTVVMNATLSSIIGDVPCASGLNWTDLNEVLRVWLNDDQFVDIPQLAVYDDEVRRVNITPMQEADVGLVFSMAFSRFNASVRYDPVVASQSLVAQDPVPLKLLRTQRRKHLDRTVGIVLLAVLVVMIAVSVVGCLKKLPVKAIDFSKIIP